MQQIYLESSVAEHPRALAIIAKYPRARVIECERYGEVFNRHGQNFRLQKQRPALILAAKTKGWVMPAPAEYGLQGDHHYYFSHMLNCPYDCRYCFLQGMYQSANYLVFVNYDAFFAEIARISNGHSGKQVWFYSGYDCDSLAFDPMSGFVPEALNFFAEQSNAWLELRTKSTQIRALLAREALKNCVVAFTFSPETVCSELEHGAPSLSKRLQAAKQLQAAGWKVGLRLDPMIHSPDFEARYGSFLNQVFAVLDADAIHSVSVGVFRLPKQYQKRLEKLYPFEPLLAGPLQLRDNQVSYSALLTEQMMGFMTENLRQYIDEQRIFPCV